MAGTFPEGTQLHLPLALFHPHIAFIQAWTTLPSFEQLSGFRTNSHFIYTAVTIYDRLSESALKVNTAKLSCVSLISTAMYYCNVRKVMVIGLHMMSCMSNREIHIRSKESYVDTSINFCWRRCGWLCRKWLFHPFLRRSD